MLDTLRSDAHIERRAAPSEAIALRVTVAPRLVQTSRTNELPAPTRRHSERMDTAGIGWVRESGSLRLVGLEDDNSSRAHVLQF